MKNNLIVARYDNALYAFNNDDDRLPKLCNLAILAKKIKTHVSDNGHKATIWEDDNGTQYEVFKDRSCRPIGSNKKITFDILVPIPGKMADKKPNIEARSKSAATRLARKLYGANVIVVESYDPHYYDNKTV